MRDVGKNMKSLREQKGLKQEELAEQLFVTRQTISNYENGRSRPDIDMLMKIAEVMETDVNSILYGPPVPEDKKEARKSFILGAVITIILESLWIYMKWLGEQNPIYVYDKWIISLYYLFAYWIRPICYLLFGWTFFQGLGYFGYAKPINQAWVKYCRWFLLIIVSMCLFSLLPTGISIILQMIFVTAEFPIIQFLNRYVFDIGYLCLKYSYSYVIFGPLLWLFGFPQPKKKRDKSE